MTKPDEIFLIFQLILVKCVPYTLETLLFDLEFFFGAPCSTPVFALLSHFWVKIGALVRPLFHSFFLRLPLGRLYILWFYAKYMFWCKIQVVKILKGESSAPCQYLNSWCSLSESLKKVTQQKAEEKRLPQKIRFNCLETSPKLDKPTHFQKTPIGNFSCQRLHIYRQNLPKCGLQNFS